MIYFKDRREAGLILADRIEELHLDHPLVLAVPNGGVPVAFEVARRLHCSLDVLSLDPDKKWHKDHLKWSFEGRNIVLIDDGIATGTTILNTLRYLREKNPKTIVVAVPVGPKLALKQLEGLADEVICLSSPEPFFSVGNWYHDFRQISEAEVLRLLEDKAYPLMDLEQEVEFHDDHAVLKGRIKTVQNMQALLIFVGGGVGTLNDSLSHKLGAEFEKVGFGTLLINLLTEQETLERKNIFDVDLLTKRLLRAIEVGLHQIPRREVPVALFTFDAGTAAAISASLKSYRNIFAMTSWSGRPDLVEDLYSLVQVPTLFLVGDEDKQLIPPTQSAAIRIANAKIVKIPHSGRSLETPESFAEVVEYSTEWLLRFIPRKTPIQSPIENVVREIESRARVVKNEASWGPLIEKLAKAKIVMLGESTHGSSEFYSLRRMITERLIRDHGFDFVAVEGDWPECQMLNEYLHSGQEVSAKEIMRKFYRWPTWMWANDETAEMVEWMQSYPVSFYGLDLYSLFESIEFVNSLIKKVQPNLAAAIEKRYECFAPFGRNEKSYARHIAGLGKGCQDQVIANLKDIMKIKMNSNNGDLFHLQQNARIIKNAEQYYRALMSGGPEAWNLRDEHMLETLDVLLKRHSSKSKGIVWAHNSHIGDYQATEMLEQGYVNLGGLARQKWGAQQVALVGFGTYQGQLLASSSWGGRPQIMPLPPAKEGSLEYYCHKVSTRIESPRFYTIFDKEAQSSVLGQRGYGHRAVGVVYDPLREKVGRHYVETLLAKRYDAFIFVDRTAAVHAIPTLINQKDLPETWPGGF